MAGLQDILSGIDPSVLGAVGAALMSAPQGERLGRSIGRATILGLTANERAKDRDARAEEREYIKVMREMQTDRMRREQEREAKKDAFLYSMAGLGSGGGAMPAAGPAATGQFAPQHMLGAIQAGFSPAETGQMMSLLQGPQADIDVPGSPMGLIVGDVYARIQEARARGDHEAERQLMAYAETLATKPSDFDRLMAGLSADKGTGDGRVYELGSPYAPAQEQVASTGGAIDDAIRLSGSTTPSIQETPPDGGGESGEGFSLMGLLGGAADSIGGMFSNAAPAQDTAPRDAVAWRSAIDSAPNDQAKLAAAKDAIAAGTATYGGVVQYLKSKHGITFR